MKSFWITSEVSSSVDMKPKRTCFITDRVCGRRSMSYSSHLQAALKGKETDIPVPLFNRISLKKLLKYQVILRGHLGVHDAVSGPSSSWFQAKKKRPISFALPGAGAFQIHIELQDALCPSGTFETSNFFRLKSWSISSGPRIAPLNYLAIDPPKDIHMHDFRNWMLPKVLE